MLLDSLGSTLFSDDQDDYRHGLKNYGVRIHILLHEHIYTHTYIHTLYSYIK